MSALRSRLTLDRLALLIVLVGAVLLVASLVRGSDAGEAPDRAARLVPSDALLYVHAQVEPGRQWDRADEIVRRLPALRRLRDRALDNVSRGRRPLDFETQVRPWIGDEAAVALLPNGRRATSLILVSVADRPLARRFLAGAGDPTGRQVRRGTVILRYGDLAASFVGEFLAVGSLANVRAAIDARSRDALDEQALFRRAVDKLEVEDPIAYAYAPARGVAQVLREQDGLLRQVRSLVDVPGLEAAAAAVRAEGNGVRLDLATLTDGGAPAPRFEPTLTEEVPSGTIAFVGAAGLGGLLETLERLSGQDTAALPGLLGRFRRQLGPEDERAIGRAVRPLQGRESALFVTPPVNLPVVTLVVSGTSSVEAGDVLVALQPVLSRLLESPSGGQVAAIVPRRIAGVDATTLSLSPTLALTYAAFDNKLVVSTSPVGIRQLRSRRGDSLADNASFFPGGLREFLDRASSVVFLDLRRLSALVERAGLAATPAYRAIESDIARIGAVSGVTASERSSQTAQIFVEVP